MVIETLHNKIYLTNFFKLTNLFICSQYQTDEVLKNVSLNFFNLECFLFLRT